MKKTVKVKRLTSPVTKYFPSGEKDKAVMVFLSTKTQSRCRCIIFSGSSGCVFVSDSPGSVDNVALLVLFGVQEDHHTPVAGSGKRTTNNVTMNLSEKTI